MRERIAVLMLLVVSCDEVRVRANRDDIDVKVHSWNDEVSVVIQPKREVWLPVIVPAPFGYPMHAEKCP